jgi:hypothetical protein
MQKLVRSGDPAAERYRDRLCQSAEAYETAAALAVDDGARRELEADAAARRTAIEATLDQSWMTTSEALERRIGYLDRNDPTPTH